MRILGSITNRIFLATALLAMLSIGAAVYFVSSRVTSETEAELQGDLSEAATLVNEQRLAIAKNIVERLGGSISVSTRPGAGTDFRIDLGDAPTQADG